MIKTTERKIDFNFKYLEKNADEALYYIFCIIESMFLNVNLNEFKKLNEKEIRDFYNLQKDRLVKQGAIITYQGPNLLDLGNKEIKYIFYLKQLVYEKDKPLNFIVQCFYGNEYHKNIGTDLGLQTDICEKNGTKYCKFIYGGTLKDSKFHDDSVVWNIIRTQMPDGFYYLGEMINYFILKNFGMMSSPKLND